MSIDTHIDDFANSPFGWLTMAVLAALLVALPLLTVAGFHIWVFTRSTPGRLFAFITSYGLSLIASVFVTSHLPYASVLKDAYAIVLLIVGALLGSSFLAFCIQFYLAAADKIDPSDVVLHAIMNHRGTFRLAPKEQVKRRFDTPIDRSLTTNIVRTPAKSTEFLEPSTGPLEMTLIYSGAMPDSLPALVAPTSELPVQRAKLAPAVAPQPAPQWRPPAPPKEPEVRRGRHAAPAPPV